MSQPDRHELELLWLDRLKDARLRLAFARTYVKEIQKDFESGGISKPDGDFAYRVALQAENAALAEYRRVLRVVTDLFVGGEPSEFKDLPPAAGGQNT